MARLALSLLILAVPSPCQEPPQDPVRVEWQVLQARLDKIRDHAKRVPLWQTFIDKQPEEHALVRTAALRLAAEWLRVLTPERAKPLFAQVAKDRRSDVDQRGRALYGLAQALELEGRASDAIAKLREIQESLPATRYAKVARAAENRLRRNAPSPRPGLAMPSLELGKDLRSGKTVTPPADAPWLLVVFSSAEGRSVRHLELSVRAWTNSGRPVTDVIAIDLAGAQSATPRPDWRFPVVATEAGFLHGDVLRLSVRAVPSTFLVGNGGRLLARDPTPASLTRILRRR